MKPPLLQTKLHRPGTAAIVERPRLLDRLNIAGDARLIAVSAPAGFGKSTLLGAWLDKREGPSAWVSLDEGDNDPVRFWTYVATALDHAHDGTGTEALTLLRGLQPVEIETTLSVLINQLAALDQPLALVLDDYHLIHSEAIHRALEFLLEHLPPNCQLAIATRQTLPLEVGRLRVQGHLVEVDAVDLRFTLDESIAFYNSIHNLSLSVQDVALLESRIEGWAAGLRLSAIRLHDDADRQAAIRGIAGKHQHIIDYLSQEVLGNLPPSMQDFLLQTAILDRLSADVCDAVTGRDDARDMLQHIERGNLFLIPLDDDGQWWRYHHLFHEFLRTELDSRSPDDAATLHQRASQWYADSGLTPEAIDHAFRAGQTEAAADMLEDISRAMMSGIVPLHTAFGWLNTLPDHIVSDRPRLLLMHAWWAVWSAQFRLAEDRLLAVEERNQASSEGPDPSITGEVACVRANIAYALGDIPTAIEQAAVAQAALTEDEVILRSLAALFEGHARRLMGQPMTALTAYQRILAPEPARQFLPGAIIGQGHFPQLYRQMGRLQDGMAAHRATQTYIKEHQQDVLPASGITLIDSAAILYEWNELDQAQAQVAQGLDLSRHWEALLETTIDGHLLMARIMHAQQNTNQRQHWIEQALHTAQFHALDALAQRARHVQARFWLDDGNLHAFEGWLSQQDTHPDQLAYNPALAQLIARHALLTGRYAEVDSTLVPLIEPAQHDQRTQTLNQIALLRARAAFAQEQNAYALALLTDVLNLAAQEGHLRTFIDEGDGLIPLLQAAASAGLQAACVADVLAAWAETGSQIDIQQPLLEPLSERELEVLHLLAEGLSNKDIGDRLFIAESTAKRHIANIYGKLNVNRRTQAIARARDLKLI